MSKAIAGLLVLIFVLVLPLQIVAAWASEKIGSGHSVHHDLFTLDSHIDTPIRLSLPGFEIDESYDYRNHYSSIDIDRLIEGGLDSGFWAIYSPQGPLTEDAYAKSYTNARRRLAQVNAMVSAQSDTFRLAKSSADIDVADADSQHTIILSIENAYPLGEDLARLVEFYKAGVRMIGLVHTRNNQFADSSTDSAGPKWQGLSPLGIKLVREANRLGMILDASHAHDEVLRQVLQLSKAPIVLSHSGVKGVFEHPRNIDDQLLGKLAASGGVICINAYGSYLKKLSVNEERSNERQELIQMMYAAEDIGQPMTFSKFSDGLLSIDRKHPFQRATFEDYMKHFVYALETVGPQHVGVGADWDGGGGVVGMEDVSMIPEITKYLIKNGYSDGTLADIWSGNVLRVFDAVERVARDLTEDSQ